MKKIRDAEHDFENEYPLYLCIIGIAATVTLLSIFVLSGGSWDYFLKKFCEFFENHFIWLCVAL